jgi:V/A-type H+-transporting ATPase subunit A
MLREDFLQQSSFSDVDAYCSLEKAYGMLRAILTFYDEASAALRRGMLMDEILNLPQLEEIARMKEVPNDRFKAYIDAWMTRLPEAFGAKAAAEGA